MIEENLVEVYVYTPIPHNNDGEPSFTWELKPYSEKRKVHYLNMQQDFDNLDKTGAGTIDYESIKLRTTDTTLNIENGDGISFKETTTPEYQVRSKPRIGNTVVYTCVTFKGE